MPRRLLTHSRQTCNRSRLPDSSREYLNTIRIPPIILSHRSIPASGTNLLSLPVQAEVHDHSDQQDEKAALVAEAEGGDVGQTRIDLSCRKGQRALSWCADLV
jgi:hypothetical protein